MASFVSFCLLAVMFSVVTSQRFPDFEIPNPQPSRPVPPTNPPIIVNEATPFTVSTAHGKNIFHTNNLNVIISVSGDPHFVTFDGRSHSVQISGLFTY